MRDVPWDELLAHVADGILVADESFEIRWMNPAAERLLGRSSARLTGLPLGDVFAGEPEIAALGARMAMLRRSVEVARVDRFFTASIGLAGLATLWVAAAVLGVELAR